jgi:hypothetical protein
MIMDGAEETDEKVEKSTASIHVPRRASLIKSMCGKFILDFEEVFHALPDTGDAPVKAWESSRQGLPRTSQYLRVPYCRLPHH